MLLRIAQRPVYVDTVCVIDPTADITDSNDFAAKFVQQASRDAAHIAKTWNHHGTISGEHPQVKHRLACNKLYTSRGRLQPSFAAADSKRLAGNHSGYRIAHMHRKRVHDPAHDLRVGIHVWGRNIAIGANQNRDLRGIPSREAFEFSA